MSVHEQKFAVDRSVVVDSIMSSEDYKDKASEKLLGLLSRTNAVHKIYYQQQKELEKLEAKVKDLRQRTDAKFKEK